MIYLDASEYGTYGLENTVPAAWIAAASSLIDAHCRRPTLGVSQYVERVRLRPDRNTVRLTYLPLATVAPATSPMVAARGRYAVPRRGEDRPMGQLALNPGQTPIGDLAFDVALLFGLPGTWSALDVTSIDFCVDTGELTLPSNPLGFGYNEVEVTYTAGLDQIPDVVKFACAQIVRNAQATPALNVRAGSLERMQLEYFADTLLDPTVCASLAPYVAQKVG
ncbi:MAG TPA: hypothetical protein VMH26_05460 [Burkholderiales bacterium]|nr:hypothetical protein [Burkholderiales bacterium]